LRVNENRFGSQEVAITDVRLFPSSHLTSGASLRIEIDYRSPHPVDAAIFCVGITQPDGTACVDVNTLDMKVPVPKIQGSQALSLWCVRLDLNQGKYFVNVGVFKEDWEYAYDYHWHVYPLIIDTQTSSSGLLSPPMRWEFITQPRANEVGSLAI
ncbi:MAG: Wzt carbohydrate-binding domain-containing protein, partial [Cyanobacteria bacterium P01_H01_bin.105]